MNCPYDDHTKPETPQPMNTVPEGYKQTEVGVIPEDWGADEIGTLEPFVTSGSRGWAKYYSKSGPAFIRITNLSRDSIYIDLSDLKFVTIPPDDSEGLRTALQDGDLLLSITADIGIIGFVDSRVPKPAYINQHIALVRLGPDKVNTNYLGYFLASESSQRHFRATTDQGAKAGMGLAGVRAIRAAFPPLPEQHAIASALSDVDALIAKLDQLITKKRDLKQAAMQELLTGRRRLPGFEGEWEVIRLGDIAHIQRGASPRPIESPIWFDRSSAVGWVRISDVTRSDMFLETTEQYLSPIGVLHSRPVKAGSLIMSICATVGRPIITHMNVCIHDGFIVFDNLTADKYFMFFMLSWIRSDWSKHGQTGSQMNLNTALIQNTRLRFPLLPEQTAIATVLSDMDAEITGLEARREKTKLLKQGMMQELLTGRIRLV